jgi:hypothetical protein
MPTEHCIKWDSSSVLKYKIPKTTDVEGNAQGIIISGISSELSARLATPGALWESNKAFCFFPKDPKSFPPEFFIGLLNSKLYNSIARLLNHTVSLQIRDIKKLPFFCFSDPDINKIVNKYSPN